MNMPPVRSGSLRVGRLRPGGGSASLTAGAISRLGIRWRLALLTTVTAILTLLVSTPSVFACGGFFCTTTPVDQNAERIIFTQNGDGTVSAYVQIEYTGSAPDFS